MNERIRQLSEKATSSRNQYDPKTMMTERIQEFDKEKFAELIVGECVEVVKWTPSMFPNDTTIKNIKEHFGVKE